MAKKKEKKPSSKRDPNAPKPIKLDKAQNKVLKDVKGGKTLANLAGLDAPLSRVGTDIPEDQRALIESLRSLSDPSSEGFVGKRSDEEKGVLDQLRSLMDQAGTTSQEETDALGALRGVLDSAGKRSGDTQGLLDQLKNRAATAGQRSEEMKETLALMKSGLAGLNAQENQALREQAQREVDRKYQQSVEALQTATRRSGMGGAERAGMRNARRDAMGAQADMEQKNLLANIDIQDTRRKDYASTLSDQESSEYDRGADALDMYGRQLTDAEKEEFSQKERASTNYAGGVNDFTSNRFNRMNTAANNWAGSTLDLSNNERLRTQGALRDYGSSLADRNTYFMDATKTNLGQERTERAAQVQSSLGLAGLTENERARRRALRANKRRGGDGRTAPTTATDPNQFGGFSSAADKEYYDTINSIYGQ
jgi:hypothetical protein